jgi:hypothetical protein
MAFVDPTTPNLADFSTFVYNQGVTTAELPTNSEYLTWAFNYAVNVTTAVPLIPPPMYPLACYNCGFHYLLKIAQDQVGQTFFTNARTQYNLLSFTAGAVVSSTDQGTSQTLSDPEFLKTATMEVLDFLKTPWGQWYLSYMQSYGPNIVGYS